MSCRIFWRPWSTAWVPLQAAHLPARLLETVVELVAALLLVYHQLLSHLGGQLSLDGRDLCGDRRCEPSMVRLPFSQQVVAQILPGEVLKPEDFVRNPIVAQAASLPWRAFLA